MIHALAFALIVFVGTTLCFTIGRWLGARAAQRDPKGFSKGNAAIDGAVYGLFGLLIAFTFSGAATRFDGRRELMGREANAIGTAYLRLDLLPDDVRDSVKKKLRDYLDARIEMFAHARDRPVALAAMARGQRLSHEVWTDAVAATRAQGGPPAIALLPPLNEMIDVATTQRVAWETHPPKVVYGMLGALAFVAALLGGHSMGGAKTHHRVHTVIYAVVLAATSYIILNIEYPRLGVIRVDSADQLLVDLRASMEHPMKLLRVILFASFMIGSVSISPRPFSGVSVAVRSNAFIDRSPIPPAYTCDGDGRSPDLEWTWIPDNARSIVIVVDDFNAEREQTVHWAVWNISPSLRDLMAGTSGGGVEGMNDFERLGYAPPCPPRGETHVYGFRLFAIDVVLSLDPQKTTALELGLAMDNHVVAGGVLIGSYTRALE